MEFDFYRNFLVLAESNTMSAAARKLNIVQTALSSQITKLEEYYGVKLVKRQKGSKHIELTAAGIEFAGKVRTLCQSEDELALATMWRNEFEDGLVKLQMSYQASQKGGSVTRVRNTTGWW